MESAPEELVSGVTSFGAIFYDGRKPLPRYWTHGVDPFIAAVATTADTDGGAEPYLDPTRCMSVCGRDLQCLFRTTTSDSYRASGLVLRRQKASLLTRAVTGQGLARRPVARYMI